MRRFVLVRHEDVTGVSGKGVVVWAIEWPDGRVSYRWNSPIATTVTADKVSDLVTVHGHDGRTVLRWIDDATEGGQWRAYEAERGAEGPAEPPGGADPETPRKLAGGF